MQITIISDDHVIIVDGEARSCVFEIDERVRAAHWDGDVGFCEHRPGHDGIAWVDGLAFAPYLAIWLETEPPAIIEPTEPQAPEDAGPLSPPKPEPEEE